MAKNKKRNRIEIDDPAYFATCVMRELSEFRVITSIEVQGPSRYLIASYFRPDYCEQVAGHDLRRFTAEDGNWVVVCLRCAGINGVPAGTALVKHLPLLWPTDITDIGGIDPAAMAQLSKMSDRELAGSDSADVEVSVLAEKFIRWCERNGLGDEIPPKLQEAPVKEHVLRTATPHEDDPVVVCIECGKLYNPIDLEGTPTLLTREEAASMPEDVVGRLWHASCIASGDADPDGTATEEECALALRFFDWCEQVDVLVGPLQETDG